MLRLNCCYEKPPRQGLVDYTSGDDQFSILEKRKILPQQQKALDLVKIVFSKIHSTGIQKILNTAVFDFLKFIVVFPVEDETKLTNKNGDILPDAKLLPNRFYCKRFGMSNSCRYCQGFSTCN